MTQLWLLCTPDERITDSFDISSFQSFYEMPTRFYPLRTSYGKFDRQVRKAI